MTAILESVDPVLKEYCGEARRKGNHGRAVDGAGYGRTFRHPGTIAGLTPHVLHHIAPIAGAAVLTGTPGSVLFGILGFVLTVPMLLRLKRRFNS